MAKTDCLLSMRKVYLGALWLMAILTFAGASVMVIFSPIGAADMAIGDSFSVTPRLPWGDWRSSPDHPGKLVRRLEVDRWHYRLDVTQECEGPEPIRENVPVVHINRDSTNCSILVLASLVPLAALVFWSKPNRTFADASTPRRARRR